MTKNNRYFYEVHQPDSLIKPVFSQDARQPDAVNALVQHAQRGDVQALVDLYDRYAPALLGMISGIISDGKLAEEILQQTFHHIRQGVPELKTDHERPFFWMLRIARKLALEKKSVFGEKTGTPIHFADSFVNETVHPQQTLSGNFSSDSERKEKKALDLVFLKGYSFAQAAEQLGLAPEILKTKLRAELKNLRGIQ